EPLIAGGGERASALEFDGVLDECGAAGRRRVDDRRRVSHARQRCPDEGLRRLQPVIGMIGAACRQIHGVARLTRSILQGSGLTNLPPSRAVMCPSAKIVSPRRSVRRMAPRKACPAYGLILCRCWRSSRCNVNV